MAHKFRGRTYFSVTPTQTTKDSATHTSLGVTGPAGPTGAAGPSGPTGVTNG